MFDIYVETRTNTGPDVRNHVDTDISLYVGAPVILNMSFDKSVKHVPLIVPCISVEDQGMLQKGFCKRSCAGSSDLIVYS